MDILIDLQRTGGEISPLWFGHNLEHTRRCIWEGLSAQMIRNRKFYARPAHDGVAMQWQRIGPADALFAIDGKAYTSHHNPKELRGRFNEIACQRVVCPQAGQRCGIAQDELHLLKGRSYELRIALRSDVENSVDVRLDGGERVHFHESMRVMPTNWREFAFNFDCASDDAEARLEITSATAGTFWIGAVSLMPSGHLLGMRRDVIQLLRDISCPILRWPGGNFAGDYRWQDGLLPVDRRGPLCAYIGLETLPYTLGYDTHEIGTDESIALCREINAEPFISINLAWDKPEDCAAWVEYCNGGPDTTWGKMRADRGHPEPHRVKYWSLGNEFGYTHMEGPNTPAAYAEKALACATAMRQVDPSIELCMSGQWRHDKWFTDALPVLAPVVQHLSYHNYLMGTPHFHGPAALEYFRWCALTPTTRILGNLQTVAAKTREHLPPGRSVGICVDEWNVWSAWFRDPRLSDAIHAAAMLNMFCREARNVGMTIGCYFEPINEGAICVDPDGAHLTPIGQVMELFKAHQRNELLQLPPQDDNASLDIAASLDRPRNRMIITLINRDAEVARDVTLELQQGAIASAEAIALGAGDSFSVARLTSQDLPVTVAVGRLSLCLPAHSASRVTCTLR